MTRRRILSAAAFITVAGGTTSLVSGQEAREIELAGLTPGWEGVAPSEIEGETNPTLTLVAGEEYTVTWTNEDGQPHNFVIEDEEGNPPRPDGDHQRGHPDRRVYRERRNGGVLL